MRRSVTAHADMDIWRVDGMSKQPDSLECEYYEECQMQLVF